MILLHSALDPFSIISATTSIWYKSTLSCDSCVGMAPPQYCMYLIKLTPQSHCSEEKQNFKVRILQQIVTYLLTPVVTHNLLCSLPNLLGVKVVKCVEVASIWRSLKIKLITSLCSHGFHMSLFNSNYHILEKRLPLQTYQAKQSGIPSIRSTAVQRIQLLDLWITEMNDICSPVVPLTYRKKKLQYILIFSISDKSPKTNTTKAELI